MEGQSEWENKGAACTSAAGQVGIGWLKWPAERVATSKVRGSEGPPQKMGCNLVKTFTTTTPGPGESHWTKVKSASKGSTFAWISSAKGSYHSQLSLTYPICNQNCQGVISMLIALLPTLVMKSAPAFPHSTEEVSWVKSLSNTMWKQIACR